MKIAVLAIVLVLSGCAVHRPPPRDVRLIPNDCGNRDMIIDYLDRESQRPRTTFESEREYERDRSQYRQRIWIMRYHCQPV